MRLRVRPCRLDRSLPDAVEVVPPWRDTFRTSEQPPIRSRVGETVRGKALTQVRQAAQSGFFCGHASDTCGERPSYQRIMIDQAQLSAPVGRRLEGGPIDAVNTIVKVDICHSIPAGFRPRPFWVVGTVRRRRSSGPVSALINAGSIQDTRRHRSYACNGLHVFTVHTVLARGPRHRRQRGSRPRNSKRSQADLTVVRGVAVRLSLHSKRPGSAIKEDGDDVHQHAMARKPLPRRRHRGRGRSMRLLRGVCAW
jgi:hypothetical protein